MNAQASHQRQRGALLLESLAAVALLALGLLGHVTLAALLARHVEEARCRTEAQQLVHGLLARMATDDPARLASHYGSGSSTGDGYREFAGRATRLPGGGLPTNAPEVRVDPGPTDDARTVTVILYWQLPGETRAHRYATATIVGGL